jgi:hypothetical protein
MRRSRTMPSAIQTTRAAIPVRMMVRAAATQSNPAVTGIGVLGAGGPAASGGGGWVPAGTNTISCVCHGCTIGRTRQTMSRVRQNAYCTPGDRSFSRRGRPAHSSTINVTWLT